MLALDTTEDNRLPLYVRAKIAADRAKRPSNPDDAPLAPRAPTAPKDEPGSNRTGNHFS
jgi:hypothetical protein